MVDFYSHRIIDLIDSRNRLEVSEWLKSYPAITVFNRDGSYSYKSAIADANPDAIQVSDRFHLIQNLTDRIKQYFLIHLPINVSVKGFLKSEKLSPQLSKEEKNRQLLFEEKIRITQELVQKGWEKSKICQELNMNPRSYDKIIQNFFGVASLKAEKKHLDTVHRKEKQIEEVNQLRKSGYSVSAIARKMKEPSIGILNKK